MGRIVKKKSHLDCELLSVNQEIETRNLIEDPRLGRDDKCFLSKNKTRSISGASSLRMREKCTRVFVWWIDYKPFSTAII